MLGMFFRGFGVCRFGPPLGSKSIFLISPRLSLVVSVGTRQGNFKVHYARVLSLLFGSSVLGLESPTGKHSVSFNSYTTMFKLLACSIGRIPYSYPPGHPHVLPLSILDVPALGELLVDLVSVFPLWLFLIAARHEIWGLFSSMVDNPYRIALSKLVAQHKLLVLSTSRSKQHASLVLSPGPQEPLQPQSARPHNVSKHPNSQFSTVVSVDRQA